MPSLLLSMFFFLLTITINGDKFDSDRIVKLYEEFKPAMALTGSLELDEWMGSLPTDAEKDEMFRFISLIYPMETYNQLNNSLLSKHFPHLSKAVQLTVLENRYCIIHEPLNATDPDFKFPRFFGFVILRSEQNTTRRLHHSAAHFETDGRVCRQAAAMFSVTGAKSLVVAGASRWAVNGSHYSPCQRKEQIADAAHNTNLMFHIANVALWEAARTKAKDREFEDHFIQWHGMAEKSCPKSPAFISIGASGSNKLYGSDGLYANRLKSSLNNITGRAFAQTPRSDTNCSLRATTNVFGRVVNGVHFGEECRGLAPTELINGHFIHIEQKNQSREDLTLWVEAFEKMGDDSPSRANQIQAQSILLFVLSIFVICVC